MKVHVQHLIFILTVSCLLISCLSSPDFEIENGVFLGEKKIENPLMRTSPIDMIYVPAGACTVGSMDGVAHEKPSFLVTVKAFYLDSYPVTVSQFEAFVNKTQYITNAEKFGDAGVLNETTKQWELVKGAYWKYPLGTNKPKALANHPVTQVSWYDAQAYAKWCGKRLPSEFEFEHAARQGVNSKNTYSIGDSITFCGKPIANTWNGVFPNYDEKTDGYHYTAPVDKFAKSTLGFYGLTGNVWQWCSNWKKDYSLLIKKDTITSFFEKSQRGGSFLCEPGWCHGYRVSGRSSSTPETALMHVGFRCAKDL